MHLRVNTGWGILFTFYANKGDFRISEYCVQILHESCNIAEKSDRWFSVSGRVKIDVGEKCFSAGKRHQRKKN